MAISNEASQEERSTTICSSRQSSALARSRGACISTQDIVWSREKLRANTTLRTNEVFALTTETLKMAKIAAIDYATAADYMTVAFC